MELQKAFIGKVNTILEEVDFEKLLESANGQDQSYAMETLKQLHQAFVEKIIADSCQLSAISSQSKASTSTGSQFITHSSQPKASVAVRNFPLSAEELRKHLGFKDGDDFYIFGTTMKGEKKILILGKRILYN